MQTEAVKKRLSNRKVELINGLECNLVGSPSDVISTEYLKIIVLLNGLDLIDEFRKVLIYYFLKHIFQCLI